jgi:hypothetical protein
LRSLEFFDYFYNILGGLFRFLEICFVLFYNSTYFYFCFGSAIKEACIFSTATFILEAFTPVSFFATKRGS